MPTFRLHLICPDHVEFEGDAESAIVPGESGYIGILANHAPLLATLGDGKLTARTPRGRTMYYNVSGGGCLEVQRNNVVVLAGRIEARRAV
ncbi:MAG TPA: F0F1 ATP synthase subunit epsilon [Sumerlaeia bacterium]|nr:F0F1 ATP synthase subunit epsilon [Sumerlaeia bacterium]